MELEDGLDLPEMPDDDKAPSSPLPDIEDPFSSSSTPSKRDHDRDRERQKEKEREKEKDRRSKASPSLRTSSGAGPVSVPAAPSYNTNFSYPQWSGQLSHRLTEREFSLPMKAYRLEGEDVAPHLPPTLRIYHRMALPDLVKYLPQIDKSSSRKRVRASPDSSRPLLISSTPLSTAQLSAGSVRSGHSSQA